MTAACTTLLQLGQVSQCAAVVEQGPMYPGCGLQQPALHNMLLLLLLFALLQGPVKDSHRVQDQALKTAHC